MASWRPKKGWKNPWQSGFGIEAERVRHDSFEAGADAMLEALKARGLYGEYGEDFIVSARVKSKDKDWAEAFFATISGMGWFIYIPEDMGKLVCGLHARAYTASSLYPFRMYDYNQHPAIRETENDI